MRAASAVGGPEVPELVTRALKASLARGYLESTRSETGRLLAALAATRTGTIAECGTGCGVGAAWLRSGAPAQTRVVTAELDPELARCAEEVCAEDGIEVHPCDWNELASLAPFSLILLDARAARRTELDDIAGLVEAGGMVVIDDLHPCHQWPPMERQRVDPMRQQWLSDPRFASAETSVAEDAAVLIAVRRS